MKSKQDIIHWIETNRQDFITLADQVWEAAELANREFISSNLQAEYLARQGFRITWDIGGLNTAFVAEWGKGKPVIGFVGEYDALGGLSQKAQTAEDPVTPGGNGHGCGHNLLGVGCLASAVAVKEWLEANQIKGTVRYYGCPAEEAGDGKVYMARAGAFDDLTLAFNYHPSSVNMPSKGSSIAVFDVLFRFHGRSSHAGGAPHLGRSGLDAVELLNLGVNYLREHVTSNVRIHYVTTKGGDAPNIVPALAEVWYFIRAPKLQELNEVYERVKKIAHGAALMTETDAEIIFQGGSSDVLSNHHLADLQYENMQIVGPTPFDKEDLRQAKEILAGYPEAIRTADITTGMPAAMVPTLKKYEKHLLIADNIPAGDAGHISTGSTDVGDLSQVTPVSMLDTTCWPMRVLGHSWGITAASRLPMGHKGMLHAAKVMALSAMDCYSDPKLAKEIRKEFEAAIKSAPYICPIPPEVKPHTYPWPEDLVRVPETGKRKEKR